MVIYPTTMHQGDMQIGTAKPTVMAAEGRPTRRRRSFGGSPEIHVRRPFGNAGQPQKTACICVHLISCQKKGTMSVFAKSVSLVRNTLVLAYLNKAMYQRISRCLWPQSL